MTLELGPADKRMLLRYAGSCRLCARPLPAGTDAVYERDRRMVRCLVCAVEPAAGPSVAGGSARREHDRRKQKREDRIRAAHPKIGGLILALSNEPQSTAAWESGAVGEEMMAARLKDLPDTMRVLHDRRIPGTQANIDHIVVSPAGVWVIDAKRYKNKRLSLHVEGGFFRPRVESLRIGGRDGTKLVEGVQKQVAVVAAVLGPEVPVTGALCFLDGKWPLFGGPFAVDGVRVTWPRALVKMIGNRGARSQDVTAVGELLSSAFPSAT